jgi:hypothetical protein
LRQASEIDRSDRSAAFGSALKFETFYILK